MSEQILFIAESLLTGLVALLLLAIVVSIITIVYSYAMGGIPAMFMILSLIAIAVQTPLFMEGKRKILFTFLIAGSSIAIITGISSTGPGIVYGLAVALMALSIITTRVKENREFRNINHELDIYQQMKIVDGISTLELGSISLLIAVFATGMTISYSTVPSLIVMGVGAVKLMKHGFIDLSSPKLLSWVIKVKYFFMDTSKLIAKTMDFKMSQQAQRVVT